MIARQNKHFCITIAISIALHLFVLTVLFTIPKPETPEGYKKIRVKFGHTRKNANPMANANKYAAFEPGSGRTNQIENTGNSNITAPEIKSINTAGEASSLNDIPEPPEKPVAAPKKSSPGKNSSDENTKIEKPSAKNQPAQVKKIAPQAIANTEELSSNTTDITSPFDIDDEDSIIIGNSVHQNAEQPTSYEQMLPLWLEKFKKYPPEGEGGNASGTGEIFIKIDRKGKILLSKVIKSTGNLTLDKALTKMILDADPVLPVPNQYHPDKKTFSYKIAIEFERPNND